MRHNYLFASHDLREALEGRSRNAKTAIDGWNAEALLSTPTADLAAELVEDYGVRPLVVHRNRMEQLPTRDTKVDVSQDRARAIFDRSQPFMIAGSIVSVVVPFDGDAALLTMQPSQRFLGTAAVGEVVDGEIKLTFEGVDPTPEQVQAYFDRQMGMIEQLVGWTNNDVATFMGRFPHDVESMVEQRKTKLLADRGLEGALGLPVRRLDDAPRILPVVRKRATVQRTRHVATGAKYEDEYAIDRQLYAEIIDIVQSMGRAIERSPRTFAKLGEEELRDHVLLQLNGTFEGQAGGELFNGEGKTDILVRVQDRNVFICECKIWHGAKAFTGAIEQLLGYLVWRDTKAALLLFIRERDATSIIAKADDALRGHPNFKRNGDSTTDPDARRNYVMHQSGDPAREITVALLPIVVRKPLADAPAEIDG